MKYKHSRREVVKKFNNLVAVGAVSDKIFCEYLLATKPTKVKKIKRVDFAKWQSNRDIDIEIMIENKLNQLVDAVNSLLKK